MQAFPQPVPVTRPVLPTPARYAECLRSVWETHRLSNQGPLHERLGEALRQRLEVPCLSLFASGTSALLVALRSLGLSGEVITTPFTFCATAHAIAWNGLTPVFCDIDPATLNLDPLRVEALIGPRTCAILPVHTYGIPCDVHALAAIATRHDLRVVYDAAAAFGVEVDGVPIGRFGDLSAFSFHATKLFNTAEGGCLTHVDSALAPVLERLRNFGIAGPEALGETGLNGKLSELHAAFGLALLDEVDAERQRRRAVAAVYAQALRGIPGLHLVTDAAQGRGSDQYQVIRIDADEFGMSRDALAAGLEGFNVFARKYFHPLCSEAAGYRALPSALAPLPVARGAAAEVLCLPYYGDLGEDGAARIAEMVRHLRQTGGRR
jgi:dTDP-4-amino-4,6-dideoxygalactose transaminase